MNIIDLIALTPVWHDATGFRQLCRGQWQARSLVTRVAFRAASAQMRLMREYGVGRPLAPSAWLPTVTSKR